MRKILIFLVLGLFLLNLASAQIETKYYIHENKVLVEYYFDSVSDLELRIPGSVSESDLNINPEYEFENLEGYNLVKINSTENLSIKYITESMINKAKKGYYFTSKNYLNEPQKVKLVLPESALLVEGGLVFPEPDSITSDGRSIILRWNNYEEGQIVINYEFVKDQSFVGYIVILFIVLFFIIYSILQRRIFKEKISKVKKKNEKKKTKENKKQNFTKNLFEDEKKIVEYLLDKKGNGAWTKEILRDVSISKVKLSRKLRSLEQKGIIKKIPYGNTNKIRILKK